MAEFHTRFVVPKSCDWTTSFGHKNTVPAEMHSVKSASIFVSDLPGPRIAQRAVSFTASKMTFMEDLKVVLRSFTGVYDDQSTNEVRLLVTNAVFDLMSADGRRLFNNLQRTANVLVGSYEEYPLINEIAVHVVGHLTAIVKFAKLLNETLPDKPTVLLPVVARLTPSRQSHIAATGSVLPVGSVKSPKFSNYFTRPVPPTISVEPTPQLRNKPTVLLVGRRPVVARYTPSGQSHTAGSFGVPVRHVGRVKSSRFSNYFTRPVPPTISVEPTSQLIAVTRPVSGRRINQATHKAVLDALTRERL